MNFQAPRKWLLFLFITLFSLWFNGYVQREVRVFREVSKKDFFDFNVYYTAGLVARSDTDRRLYSYEEIPDPNNSAQKIVVNPQLQSPNLDSTFGSFAKLTNSGGQYLYPPFFSMVIAPLTYLPYENAKILWHILIFLLVGVSIVLTVKLVYKDYLTILIISGISLAVLEFTNPMQDLLYGSNVSSLILVLCMAGLYLHKKYPIFGALFFSLAVIIKLTPIVILPLMIIKRQWKWLYAFCGWSAFLWGIAIWRLGWENHYEFLSNVMPAMFAGMPFIDNRTVGTFLYALQSGKFLTYEDIYQGEYNFPSQLPLTIFKVLSAISFSRLMLFFMNKNKGASQIYTEVFLLLLWSLIFSPVSLRYSYLLAASPIIFAWIHPLTKQASTFRLALLSFGTLAVFSVLPGYGLMTINSFPLQLAAFMVMPIGILLCMYYLVTLLKVRDKTFPDEYQWRLNSEEAVSQRVIGWEDNLKMSSY